MSHCPLCGTSAAKFRAVSGIDYLECQSCDFIFAENGLLESIDSGHGLVTYDDTYWQNEHAAAQERSYGAALARVAETLLYARIPVNRFIDIRSGSGALLDALSIYLPGSSSIFYGAECYPPPPGLRTKNENFFIGNLDSLNMTFQAGCCIEVIEHLTPRMVSALAQSMAKCSDVGAIYFFNTGLTSYVKNENSAYIDPFDLGHITFWSVAAARKLFEPFGFTIFPVQGKSWAFVAEYLSSRPADEDIRDRIWNALDHNKKILHDPKMGSLLYVLGIDAARAYS